MNCIKKMNTWTKNTNQFVSIIITGGRYFRHKNIILRFFCVLTFCSCGCNSVGPMAMKGERINYNVALQQTNDEQVLLNLVRLKYRDTPIFIEVSGINSKLSFQASAEVGTELKEKTHDIFSLGGGVAYMTEPVITYTPLQGQDFVQRLLTPISLDTFILLYQSGWSLKRVMRLCVQRLNEVENAPRGSGPTPKKPPEYSNFARVLDLMRELEQRRCISFIYEMFPATERQPRIVMQVTEEAWTNPEMEELAEILNLVRGRRHYPVSYPSVEHEENKKHDRLVVETRSVLGILSLLSNMVEVPTQHLQEGKVTITRYDTGQPFDWGFVVGELFHIKSHSSKPTQASVAVHYRGSWFFIDDSDPESKSTFSLLSQLLSLQSGKTDRLLPLLTLPIGK